MEGLLVLEDGRAFRGRAFGAPAERIGEIVFNTSMTGYQEVLTDPSYWGQIVVMTCPHIGNYGTNTTDNESESPQVEGFVVREAAAEPSNWRAHQALPQYLREHGIPGIAEVDTRAITRHIRTRGAMRAVLSSVDRDVESLARKAREAPRLGEIDLVRQVRTARPFEWEQERPERWRHPSVADGRGRARCIALDFGIKHNILRLLRESGFDVDVMPGDSAAEEILGRRPDAVFLSNGPGDPETCSYAVATVERLVGEVPIFGICLGHQISALALGARTFKLKFGHRGSNHPVKDLRTGHVAVTSQNHGYAVDTDTLPDGAVQTHVNLNDGTCEGFRFDDMRLMAVQYHPESSPGPHDSLDLFHAFRELVLPTEGKREHADGTGS